ncbi:MAG: cupin domain-containing protein [Deltaproteobacteria bacterium]|nr:cupin domain-containing protein [Deltaproteobacteria bacterium]
MEGSLTFDPDGEVAPFHNHPKSEQFFIVQTGEWLIRVGEEEKKITPGDIVHIPAGVYEGRRPHLVPRIVNFWT